MALLNADRPSNPLVLYHAKCDDGFGAAYAAWESLGNDAAYRPVCHGDPLLEADVAGRDVYILDFSFPPDLLIPLCGIAQSITLLDHHKSAVAQWSEQALPANVTVIFDMSRSGAQLAWDYFHPGVRRPRLIDYIGDRDLWQFKLPQSKEFSAGLQVVPMEFDAWQHLDIAATIEQGRTILLYQQAQIDSAVNKPLRTVTLGGHLGLALNAVGNTSEIGNALALKSGTFGLVFFVKDDEVICSLRSVAPFDVSEIATSFGGGGHAQAAGFTIPVGRFFKEIW